MESNLVQNPKLLSNLPSSWSVLFFQDLVKDFSGGNKKILKSEFLDKGKYLIVDQGKEMVAGFTNDVDALVNSSPPYIIFGDHTRIFKYINVAFAMGADGTKVLKAQDENNLNEKFLYYFFLTLNIPNTGYNRHFKYLKNSKIPLPPLAEQQKIADILDAADALRQKDQQLIDHYTTLSQSLFLEMFGDPVTNPMGWEAHELENSCYKITDGTHQSPTFLSEGIPFLLVSNIVDNEIVYKTNKYISKDEYNSLTKNTPIEVGDILYTSVGSYGNPAIVKSQIKFCFQRHIAQIKVDHEKIHVVFLHSLLQTNYIKRQADRLARGVAQKTLNLKAIKSFSIIIPPITLQNQFANHIANIEKQKQQAQASLAQSNNLFNSLLQKAFTGELTA